MHHFVPALFAYVEEKEKCQEKIPRSVLERLANYIRYESNIEETKENKMKAQYLLGRHFIREDYDVQDPLCQLFWVEWGYCAAGHQELVEGVHYEIARRKRRRRRR